MDEVVKQLIAWAKLQPEITALYLYGSMTEARANALSDLDIGLLVRPEYSKQEIWQLENRWLAIWPEVVDLRVLNGAPLAFRFEVTTRGQRLWVADAHLVAEQESLIWRAYWDEEPRLKAEMDAHFQQVAEARNAVEQQKYHATLEKVGAVHRRVREAAANALQRISS